MPHSDAQESQTLGVYLVALGAILAASAAGAAVAAAAHMAVATDLCGPAINHCLLCVVSAGSLLASAGVAAAGVALLRARPCASPHRARTALRQTN